MSSKGRGGEGRGGKLDSSTEEMMTDD